MPAIARTMTTKHDHGNNSRASGMRLPGYHEPLLPSGHSPQGTRGDPTSGPAFIGGAGNADAARGRSGQAHAGPAVQDPDPPLDVERRDSEAFLPVDPELQPEPVGPGRGGRVGFKERRAVLVQPAPGPLLALLRRDGDGACPAAGVVDDLQVGAVVPVGVVR